MKSIFKDSEQLEREQIQALKTLLENEALKSHQREVIERLLFATERRYG